MDKYRSPISKAKGLGSSHSGVHHWIHQRFTSILMLVFVSWIIQLIATVSSEPLSTAIETIKKPYNILAIAVFISTLFYHASLGMQVIIEDYCHCRMVRIVLLLSVKIVSMLTVASMLVALIHLMTV